MFEELEVSKNDEIYQKSIDPKSKQQTSETSNRDERINARATLESKAMLVALTKFNHVSISEFLETMIKDAANRVMDKEKLEDIYLDELSVLIGKNQKNTGERNAFYNKNREMDAERFVKEAEEYFGMPISEVPPEEKRDYLESKYNYIVEELSRYAIYPICKKFNVERLTILNRIRKKETQRKIVREARLDTGKTIDEFTHDEALDYVCKKTQYGTSQDNNLYYRMFGLTRSEFRKRCRELSEQNK